MCVVVASKVPDPLRVEQRQPGCVLLSRGVSVYKRLLSYINILQSERILSGFIPFVSLSSGLESYEGGKF